MAARQRVACSFQGRLNWENEKPTRSCWCVRFAVTLSGWQRTPSGQHLSATPFIGLRGRSAGTCQRLSIVPFVRWSGTMRLKKPVMRRSPMSADERVDVYLPLYVRDFLTSTIGWSAEERGHYLTLLMLQWDRDGLPAELDLLEKLSPGIGSVWHVLHDKFPVEQDGMRRNQRLEEHRARAVELRKKRSEAGRAGASARFAQANAQQTHSNRMANVKHPPSPSPSTSPSESSAVAEDVSQQAAPVVAPSDPPRRRNRSRPKDAIYWDCDDGWQGITDADRSTWATAFPACTRNIELVRAAEWLRANPTKARKSNWRRFLVS